MKTSILLCLLIFSCQHFAFSQNELVTKELLDGKIKMLLPKNFSNKHSEQKRSKERIDIMLSNEDQSSNFSLNITQTYFTSNQLSEVVESVVKEAKKFDPSFKLKAKGVKALNNMHFAFWNGTGSTGLTYAFFTIKDRQLYEFHFSAYKNETKWLEIFDKIFSSVTIN